MLYAVHGAGEYQASRTGRTPNTGCLVPRILFVEDIRLFGHLLGPLACLFAHGVDGLCLGLVESLMISRLLAHNLLIGETSRTKIRHSNSNEHVTRRGPAHVLTQCYMLEEDNLIMSSLRYIYTLGRTFEHERARGPDARC